MDDPEIEYHTECRYPDCFCKRIPDSREFGGFRLECLAEPIPPLLAEKMRKEVK